MSSRPDSSIGPLERELVEQLDQDGFFARGEVRESPLLGLEELLRRVFSHLAALRRHVQVLRAAVRLARPPLHQAASSP